MALAAGLAPAAAARANLHPYDPEHLIVNGLGGAFLHPTHVFAPARFASVRPAAGGAAAREGLYLQSLRRTALLCTALDDSNNRSKRTAG